MIKSYNLVMHKMVFFVLSGMLLTCSSEPLITSTSEADVTSLDSKITIQKDANKSNRLHFTASLKGSNETTPNDSNATGQAIVHINKEETMIHYKLIVSNIENVTMAHFHMGAAGTNGGVVVWLYDNRTGQPSGIFNGVLAEGYINESDLTGGLTGKTIGDLVEAIRDGLIYVNVHTTAIGSGEIRGQL
ncbi:CHRD domain-containing protein [Tamlana fucoidanivorans]|uniref:CHRD domain-containing protein n=1 Tax=Allotamlana fucoidanivorans TaxID=2583814 RepID=A0A5C4SL80_9FLAO|nr:CHRD domain-containing protein [Tamlana fucoidanivorans]TNJ44694.1 CHRD domain-containing protein [Tamlana fucoidanivorans]